MRVRLKHFRAGFISAVVDAWEGRIVSSGTLKKLMVLGVTNESVVDLERNADCQSYFVVLVGSYLIAYHSLAC
jgi:hypothetical protein